MTKPLTSGGKRPTPILHRELPLPRRNRPGTGLFKLLLFWYGTFAILGMVVVLLHPTLVVDWILGSGSGWLGREWDRWGPAGFMLALVSTYYLMIAIHESGHAVAGQLVGFRLKSLRVGPLLFTGPLRVSWYSGPGAVVNGVAEIVPAVPDHLRRRGMVMVLGGPGANFFSALVVVLLPGQLTIFGGAFVGLSIANGLSDLMPFESRLGVSDGRRILMMLTNRALGERWIALLRLGSELREGVLPEALSPWLVTKLTVMEDASVDTAVAHAVAFAVAFHQHRDAEAGQYLETALRHAGHAMPVMRDALMSDAAVFLARRWNRPDLAQQWLRDISSAPASHSARVRAEAAILEAKGDKPKALAKLGELDTWVRSLPEKTQHESTLRLLERWRSDMLAPTELVG